MKRTNKTEAPEEVRKTVTVPAELHEFALGESKKLPGAPSCGNFSAMVRVLIEQARVQKKGRAA